jgi:hypothetical protein
MLFTPSQKVVESKGETNHVGTLFLQGGDGILGIRKPLVVGALERHGISYTLWNGIPFER